MASSLILTWGWQFIIQELGISDNPFQEELSCSWRGISVFPSGYIFIINCSWAYAQWHTIHLTSKRHISRKHHITSHGFSQYNTWTLQNTRNRKKTRNTWKNTRTYKKKHTAQKRTRAVKPIAHRYIVWATSTLYVMHYTSFHFTPLHFHFTSLLLPYFTSLLFTFLTLFLNVCVLMG
jgi:magnesium-transporting ATPase (P-type)